MRCSVEDLKLGMGFWYPATPYTKWWAGLDDAAHQAALVAGGLIKRGVAVYSPIVQAHVIALANDMDCIDAEMWLAADRPMAHRAHGIIVANMRGWDDNYGVDRERQWFSQAKKPSFLLDLNDWTAETLA